MGRLFKPTRKLKNSRIWTSSKWYLEYQNADGIQVRIPASNSKRDAALLLHELEVNATRARMGLEPKRPRRASMLLSELSRKYLEDIPMRVREKTLKEYQSSLKDLVLGGVAGRAKPWFPVKHALELTPGMVMDYQREAGKFLSPRTVNVKLKALLQALRWAKRNQSISENPLEDIQLLPERGENRSRSFTPIEIVRLLNASAEGVKQVWEVFLGTGLRKREMSSMKWSDVDFDRGRLTVRSSVSKNHKERRIPMSSRVREILFSLQDQGEEFVFPSIGNWKNFYEGSYRELKRICSQLGIEGVDIHSFRRTFAVRQLQQGVSPAEVQKLMGHATANMTLEVYAMV